MNISSLKDIFFAPIYLYQGITLKRTALRLPEAKGERHGNVFFTDSEISDAKTPNSALNLMMIGDSSAAGVGVDSQQDALMGHLLRQLQTLPNLKNKFRQINWALHATSGHTSFDALRRLYILPKPSTPIDIMIVVVGVNDTTKNVSTSQWQNQIEEIITIARRKFEVQTLIFSCLPPMSLMPAIPRPLNSFIGAKATMLDKKLQTICQTHNNVHYFAVDFAASNLSIKQVFAEDGFHPSGLAYEYWAKEFSKLIKTL